MICVHCGYFATRMYIALADQCPSCLVSPFREDVDVDVEFHEVCS